MGDDLWGEPDFLQGFAGFGLGEGEGGRDGEEEDDDDHAGGVINPGAQHCLLLVDVGCEGLWEERFPDPDGSEDLVSSADLVWRAAETMVREKIKTTMVLHTGKRDSMGLVLYNTRNRTPIPIPLAGADDEEKKDEKKDDNDDDDDDDNDDDAMETDAPPTTVHDILPLHPPGIDTVKQLRRIQCDLVMGRERDLQEQYGHEQNNNSSAADDDDDDEEQNYYNDSNPLDVAFQHAVQIFKTSKSVRKVTKQDDVEDVKQIWVFTSNDNPLAGNDQRLHIVKTNINDAQEEDIRLVVWALPKLKKASGSMPPPPFDYSLFYEQVGAEIALPQQQEQPSGGDNDEAQGVDVEETLDLSSMQSVWKTVRKALVVPLLLPDWKENMERPGIAMDLYRLILTSRIPNKIRIHQETGRMLTSIRQQVPEGGGGEILSEFRRSATSSTTIVAKAPDLERFRSFVALGDDQVPMTEHDKNALKLASNANSEFASLILLGFRDKDTIPFHHSVAQAYFALPSDERTAGSALAFAHLHASMLRKGVLAVGELLPRKTSSSHLVAIYALEEEMTQPDDDDDDDEDDWPERTRPPGFMIIELPFEDEMRNIPPDAAVEALKQPEGTDLATEEVVQAAEKLVQKQTIRNFAVGENLQNARVAKFWEYVEHVVLELPKPVPSEYDTIPDQEEIRKLVGQEADAFAETLPEDVKPEPKKRKLVPDANGELNWESIYRDGDLDKVKNDDLKKKLKSLGEKVSGKKQDLIDRLLPHLAEEFAAKVKEEDVGQDSSGTKVKEEPADDSAQRV